MGDRGRWDAAGHWIRWDGQRPAAASTPAPAPGTPATWAATGAVALSAAVLVARLRHR